MALPRFESRRARERTEGREPPVTALLGTMPFMKCCLQFNTNHRVTRRKKVSHQISSSLSSTETRWQTAEGARWKLTLRRKGNRAAPGVRAWQWSGCSCCLGSNSQELRTVHRKPSPFQTHELSGEASKLTWLKTCPQPSLHLLVVSFLISQLRGLDLMAPVLLLWFYDSHPTTDPPEGRNICRGGNPTQPRSGTTLFWRAQGEETDLRQGCDVWLFRLCTAQRCRLRGWGLLLEYCLGSVC